jgi:hypothetical protein
MLRSAILAFAGIKLVAFLYRVARQPEFRVAAADYGAALAIMLVGAGVRDDAASGRRGWRG